MVGAIGAGMNHAGPLARIVREADVDVVLLAGEYTLLDQNGERELLPLCVERGVRVDRRGRVQQRRARRPVRRRDVLLRTGRRLRSSSAPARCATRARDYGVSLTAAAMQFPLRHPAVETVLVGMRSPDEVAANVAAFQTPIPDDLWTVLAEL